MIEGTLPDAVIQGLPALDGPVVWRAVDPAQPFGFAAENGRLVASLPGRLPKDAELLAAAEAVAWTLPDPLRDCLTALVEGFAPKRGLVLMLLSGDGPRLMVQAMAALARDRLRFRGELVLALADPALLERHAPYAGRECRLATIDAVNLDQVALLLFHSTQTSSFTIDLDAFGQAVMTLALRVPSYFYREDTLVPVAWSVADGQLVPRLHGDDPIYDAARGQPFSRSVLNRGGVLYKYLNVFGHVRSNGYGPVDGFGFRLQPDFHTLANRPANHLLVAMFGGSAVEGVWCFHDDTIPRQLEKRLQEELGRPVTVLNFGVSAATILQEMNHYLLFCHRLRLDAVVDHTGHNDLLAGMMTDPGLLKAHDFIYNIDHFINDFGPDEVRFDRFNPPHLVANAFVARVMQFAGLVAGAGIPFVFGLQPLSTDKPLGPAETEAVNAFLDSRQANAVAERVMKLPFVNQFARHQLEGALAPDRHPLIRLADPAAAVAALGPDQEVFLDHVHLTACGNRAAADAYVPPLLQQLSAKLRETT